jgi:hypothetical protein
MATVDWYRHRGAWRTHYRNRAGKLIYARAAYLADDKWEIRLFTGELTHLNTNLITTKQNGTLGLPDEVRAWVNRRARNGKA